MKPNELNELGLTEEIISEIINLHETETAAYKAKLDERDEQLQTLKKSADDTVKLKLKLENLHAENKTNIEKYQRELHQLKVNNAAEKSLMTANARNVKVIMPLLYDFLSTAEIDTNGEIKGLSEQIKTLTEADDTKFLFENEQPTFQGITPGEKSDASHENIDTSKMNYAELCAYMQANPDANL